MLKIIEDLGVKRAFLELKKHNTVPLYEASKNWIKNKHIPYQWIVPEQWQNFKTSDTVFLFGSGPSINDITEEEWKIIKSHDSFGLNFAFLTYTPMTFFYLGYEPSSKQIILDAFNEEIRKIYKDTLWFVPSKVLCRLVHPRTIPEFFPPSPKLANFNLPNAIYLEADRPFQREDFQNSLMYRGVMGVGIHLANQLGYRNIVLMGVDLHTYHHFFDDFEVTKEERKIYNQKMAPGKVFEAMIPKYEKYRTMEEYYYALNELYFPSKGMHLYVGNKNNMLSPRIPIFPEFDK